MTLDFSAYPNADAATKDRTEQFFESVSDPYANHTVPLTLIQRGICTEARDTNGDTALLKAALNGRTKTVQALLAAGASIDARNTHSFTALINAAGEGYTQIVQELLVAGVKIDARHITGDTALISAATHGHLEIVRALVAAGATIDATDNYGNTALAWAACNGHIEIVQALLALGATLDTRDGDGDTPLMLAACNGHTGTVQALLEAGANVEVWDNHGNTVLIWADTEEMKHVLSPAAWHASYEDLIAQGTAPTSAEEVYHLLAVTPLVDPSGPVDYTGNIQRIFANAKWESKEQAASILTQMQRDGRIAAETVDSILGTNFPEQAHVGRLKPRNSGIVR